MGYVRGNFWVLDPVYDEFLSLPCVKALHTAIRLSRIRKDHFSFDVKFSYITRQYTCEAFEMWKPEKSATWYNVPASLGYGRHPLDALIAAINLCEHLEQTPRIKVCILECEVWLLSHALKQAKTVEAKVEKALDNLADVLKKLEPEEITWDEVFSDLEKVEGGWADKNRAAVSATLNEMQPENIENVFGTHVLYDDDDL